MASRTYSATVAADGTATATIQPTGSYPWSVSQVSVEMATAPVGAACSVRKNGFLVSPVIATGDAASGEPPVTLNYDDVMTVEWTGCTSGDVGKVLIIYDEVRP